MQEPLDLKAAIYKVGRDKVDCQKQCVGVGNDKAKGIIPR